MENSADSDSNAQLRYASLLFINATRRVEQALEESNAWIREAHELLSRSEVPAIESAPEIKAIEPPPPAPETEKLEQEEEKETEEDIARRVEQGKKAFAQIKERVAKVEVSLEEARKALEEKSKKMEERLARAKNVPGEKAGKSEMEEIEELLRKAKNTGSETREREAERQIDELLAKDPAALEKFVQENFQFSDEENDNGVANKS